MPEGESMIKSSGVANRDVSVASCRAHPDNYNRHDDGQIDDLRLSLRRFGQVRSIVVQDDGAGRYLLVAGHGIYQAAALEGLTVLRADVIPADWSPVRVAAYLAADNELARRGMPDEAQLAALVARVQEEADAELAKLAAGGELEAEIIKFQAELEAALAEPTNQDQSGNWKIGNGAKLVKPVLHVEDLATFERAILATGKTVRGEAVIELCAFYLEAHGHGAETGQ